jgi:hypothetical protein
VNDPARASHFEIASWRLEATPVPGSNGHGLKASKAAEKKKKTAMRKSP